MRPPMKMRYAAFISYSHAADGKLAPRLQAALRRFAIPWYQWRSRAVFRDETSLAMTPELWPDIQKALDNSEHFILLASPDAAASEWVEKEIAYWLWLQRTKPLIVWTDGTMSWMGGATRSDFDFEATTALPPSLKAVYSSEPLYLDLRWARSGDRVTLRDPRLKMAVARITAALEGKTPDQIIDLDIRHRRKLAITGTVVGVLLLGLAITSWILKIRADTERKNAELRLADGLISEGNVLGSSDRWFEAKQRFDQAGAIFDQVGASRFASEVGRWDYYRHAVPVLHSFQAHHSAIVFAALSWNGRRLATAANEKDRGTVCVWDTVTWSLLRTFDERMPIADLAMSPDGSSMAVLFASVWSSKPMVLLDVDTGKPISLQSQITESAIAVRWAGNSKLVTGGRNGQVNVLDVATGKTIGPQQGNPAEYASAVGVSDDGTIVAWGSDWKGSSLDDRPVTSVAVSPDGKLQAYGYANGLVRLAGPASSSIPSIMMDDSVKQLAFTRIGHWLMARTGPKSANPGDKSARSLHIWDPTTGAEARLLENVPADITSAAISADGGIAVSGDSHGRLTAWGLWNPAMRSPVRPADLEDHTVNFNDTICPGGRLILHWNEDCNISLWSTDTRYQLRHYQLPPPQIDRKTPAEASTMHHIEAVSVSADLRSVIARDDSNRVIAWDMATQDLVTPGAAFANQIPATAGPSDPSAAICAMYLDGSRSARSAGASIKLLDRGSGEPLRISWQCDAPVKALTFGPTKEWVFSSATDRTLQLWNVANADGEVFRFHVRRPGIAGDGTIESPDAMAAFWDNGGNTISTPFALLTSLQYVPSPGSYLLVETEHGPWVFDLGWATRAETMAPVVQYARARLEADPQDAAALLLVADWFALCGAYDSAISFYERAQSAGGKPDPYVLCCCYLSEAYVDQPSAPDAKTREHYDQLVHEWHLRRLEYASKAQAFANDECAIMSAPVAQRQTAAAYARIGAAIEAEEQQKHGN